MMTEPAFLFLSVFFLTAILILAFIVRAFIKFRADREKLASRDKSDVSFVVETFHDLVAKLKEKEKELEVLRKIAEQRAEDVESYNRNILQSVPSGVISFDRDLKIESINYSAEKILGLKAEETIGKGYELMDRSVSNLIRDGKFIDRGEIQCQTSSGRLIWLGLTLSPLKDGEGNEIGRILVFTDLTELKALEAQAELRKKLSSLGEMSAGIAHELRNPLGVIAGYTKLLAKKADASLISTIDAISKEVDVMDRIISDFLSFARPVELSIAKINLAEVINGCISSLSLINSNIRLSVDIKESLSIAGDEILLRQAFTNLIQNAIEAMKDGGELSFGCREKGDYIEITITDTGHGIPAGIREKIFLPFYTTKEKGTGLGLAIVHKIITAHGGSIVVESAGSGTTFRLRLPKS